MLQHFAASVQLLPDANNQMLVYHSRGSVLVRLLQTAVANALGTEANSIVNAPLAGSAGEAFKAAPCVSRQSSLQHVVGSCGELSANTRSQTGRELQIPLRHRPLPLQGISFALGLQRPRLQRFLPSSF
jgi:hypothetical protein